MSRVSLVLLLTGLAIVAIKSIFFLLDARPAYFLDDSKAYLYTAYFQYIPPDRSFTYGYLLSPIVRHIHSGTLLVGCQVLLSAVSAWLIAVYLIRFFHTRSGIAIAFGVLCALEPLQLAMERFIMTETVATFLFAVYLGLVLEYLWRGDWRMLVAAQISAVFLISIRISFLPEVVLNSVLAPLLSPQARECWDRIIRKTRNAAGFGLCNQRIMAGHLLLSIVVSQGALIGYSVLYGHLTKAKPALLHANGYFLLADLMPIVKPEDYPIASQRQALFANLKRDPHVLANRLWERWEPGEVCDRIGRWWPDNFEGNAIANMTAINAMKRDPAGVVMLIWREFLGYFNVGWFRFTLLQDEGYGRDLPDTFVQQLRSWLHVNNAKEYEPSITKAWRQAAMPWYWFILCFLLVSPTLMLFSRPEARAALLVCIGGALLFFEGATLTVEQPNARYLTTAAWLVILLVGVVASRIVDWIRPDHSSSDSALRLSVGTVAHS